MPKGLNFKGFARRKSSGNILDIPSPDEQSSGVGTDSKSTFRVIERPDKKAVTYGAAPDRSVTRPFNSPIHALRGKSENDVSKGSARQRVSAWPLTGATRGSGGTTNSGSSGYYDSSSASARHSSTSTLPSSVDHPEEEELFPPRSSASAASGMYQTVSAGAEDHAPLPPPPSFSSRALRSFSFGRPKTGRQSTDTSDTPPVPPVHQANGGNTRPGTSGDNGYRDRAMTTSSYASTAVPNKPELNLGLGNDFGDDFSSSMFDSLQKKEPPPPLPLVGSFHRTVGILRCLDGYHADCFQESEPMYPPRTLSRNQLSKSPSPSPLQLSREQSTSPYAYDEPNSAGYSTSSALSSPDPSVPNGGSAGDGIAQAFLGGSKTGYAPVPDRYASPVQGRQSTESFCGAGFMANNGTRREQEYPNRQNHVDDDDRWVKKVELRDPQASASTPANRLAPAASRGNAGPTRSGAASPGSSAGESWAGSESITTTPRAAGRVAVTLNEESMFDSSPSGPASRAIRPAAKSPRADDAPKKMTNAQYQALQKQRPHEDSVEQDEEEEHVSSDEYDDDDVDRAKKLAIQRRQQEATMSVYRQQMKKVTGGGPSDLPASVSSIRPSNDRSASSSSGFHFGGISGTPPAETVRGKHTGEEDEDVPLGILAAHNFPGANRPPTSMGQNDMNQRRASMAGSVMGGGGGGNLPAFARNLPVDPYFGAGLVNQSARESLAMHSAGSTYGAPQALMPVGQQPTGHPAGLVGVIAGEEKARAARRGSPNTAAGNFSTVGNMPMNVPPPQMGRAMSMGNLAPPSVYSPSGMPPMPMMPQMGQMTPGMDPQMQQFMQMQMQMMQTMMNMQQAQSGQTPMAQPPQQGNDYFGPNRPMSMASQHSYQGAPHAQGRPQTNQGRSMTMMNPPPGWNNGTSPGQSRPTSMMPPMGSYAPSVNGLQVHGQNGDYAPSMAPSERSNVGMPSRYRTVNVDVNNSGRTNSMTSTLHAFTAQQPPPGPGTPYNGPGATYNVQSQQQQAPKSNSTIRVIEKSKGGMRMSSLRPTPTTVEDEDEGWGDAKKKRDEKKKSRFGFGRSKKEAIAAEPALSEIYQNLD